EGNEGGRNVEIVEGTRHGIFSSDGREAEFMLGVEGSEKGGEGKTPAFGIGAEFREIFLKREADVGKAGSGGDGFADGFGDGIDRTEEGGTFRKIGIVTPAHEGGGVAF